ncbi:MAG: YdgA family protein [Legionella sp.]
MKKFAGLVVIISLLTFGSYYGMGLITERTLKKDVDLINQSSGLHVKILEYQRGLYSSTAKFNWHLHLPERVIKGENGNSSIVSAQDYAIDMPLTIYHGPIIFAESRVHFGLGYAFTDLTLPQSYEEQFSAAFTAESTKPQMNISILVNYLNKSRLQIHLPTFKLIAKEGSSDFEWLGMTNHLSISSNLKNIKGDLVISGVNFTKESMKGTLGKISSDYNLHKTKENLYLGSANLSFPSMVVTDKDKVVFNLEQFDVSTSSKIEKNLFHSEFNTSVQKITAEDKLYGPGALKMSINNLDSQALAEINAQVTKMQQGSEQDRQQATVDILPLVAKLLNKGPEFKISEIYFSLPQGKVSGYLTVSIPKGDISNPLELIQKTVGQGKIIIPVPVIKSFLIESVQQSLKTELSSNADANKLADNTEKNDVNSTDNKASQPVAKPESTQVSGNTEDQLKNQADKKLAELVASGLLIQKGNDYEVNLSLENGQIFFNNKPYDSFSGKF